MRNDVRGRQRAARGAGLWVWVWGVCLASAGFSACAAEDPDSGRSGNNHAGTGAAGSGVAGTLGTAGSAAGSGGFGGSAAAGSGGGAGSAGSGMMIDECPAVSQTAQNERMPADIIIGIDTSGSMDKEIVFVQQHLNAFSQQIIDSGVDAHVILLATPGTGAMPDMTTCTDIFNPACWNFGGDDLSVCIAPPLGSGMCPDDSNLPTYAHVPSEIGSTDMLNVFVAAYPAYKPHLRERSNKTFVAITDDDANSAPLNSADAFQGAVASLELGNATWWANWSYSGIYCFTDCEHAADIGTVHDALVTATGGVRGDLCLQDFAPVFDALAKEVVAAAKLACDWEIPAPPDGKTFEPLKTNVNLEVEGQGELLGRAADQAGCQGQDGWYYDSEPAPTRVVACPATCERIQAANSAKVDILFGCEGIPLIIE